MQSNDPAHHAVEGGFECPNCGTTRRTPLGMWRHRSYCDRKHAATGGGD